MMSPLRAPWRRRVVITMTLACSVATPAITRPVLFGAVVLRVAGRSNATPTIATLDRFVAVTWGATPAGGAADVFAAVSRDGGRTFAAPVRVNDVPGETALGGEQPPHVALVPHPHHDPDLVIIWTAKSTDGTHLLTAQSTNGGVSFGRATPVSATVAGGSRGW